MRGEPSYLDKEDYGKVPQYLGQVREEIKREKDMIDRYVKEQMGIEDAEPEQLEDMSESERNNLLNALKAKWQSVNNKYQKMTHIVLLDTTGQVRRKEQMEGELKQLEADIERLQKPGPIMIRKWYVFYEEIEFSSGM